METTNQSHCQKISKGIGLLWHSSKECPKNILTLIYETLVLLSFTYCCTTWGFTYHTYINILHGIKKSMRIITHFTTNSFITTLLTIQIFKHLSNFFDKDIGKNWRQISLLCPAAKTLEKLLQPKMLTHVPFHPVQHWLRPKHSTCTAMPTLLQASQEKSRLTEQCMSRSFWQLH